MKKTWSYFINPFEVATANSYENAYRISVYHLAALDAAKTDTFFSTLFAAYQPIHNAFVAAFNHWKQQGGQQISNTEHLNQLFLELIKKSKTWDIKIQNVYENTTPEYLRLLPHGRSNLQTGSQQARLTALENLGTAIGSDTALQTVKTEVVAFYTLLNTVFSTQKSAINTTGNQSNEVETNRVAICTAQYANLGALINKYANNPTAAEGYFDLSHIRRSQQNIFTAQLQPNEVHFIAKRKLNPDDNIELDNTGNTELQFYIADSKTANPATSVVTVTADSTKTIKAADLGNIANAYIMVKNNNNTYTGSFELYLV